MSERENGSKVVFGVPKRRKHEPDTTPVHIPGKSDVKKPLTLREEMRRYIREQVSLAAASDGLESFEEADDFDVEDDIPDLTSPYTVHALRPEGVNPVDDLEGEPEQGSEKTGNVPPGDQVFGGEAAQARSAETPAPSPGPEPPPGPK